MAYDDDNVFAKILRGELPANKVYEDEFVLAFDDINPKTPVHVLIVPKDAYVDYRDFIENARPETVVGFFRAVNQVARLTGVAETGFRLVANNGASAGQIVFHFHMHLYGGRPLGGMVRRADDARGGD